MREQFILQDRVQMIGSLPQSKIRSMLVKGHIFLNTSLTEGILFLIQLFA